MSSTNTKIPELAKIGVVAKYFGVTTECIREWERKGQIESIRTANGTRVFNLRKIIEEDKFSKGEDFTEERTRGNIFYCRVSTRKQEEDLKRQISIAQEKYPNHEIVSDIGSGLNWKRKGLRRILERASQGDLQEIVVFHRDRLCRFGFEILEYIFNLNDTRLVVHEHEDFKTATEELTEDLMAITHVFSCSYYGKRRYKSQDD